MTSQCHISYVAICHVFFFLGGAVTFSFFHIFSHHAPFSAHPILHAYSFVTSTCLLLILNLCVHLFSTHLLSVCTYSPRAPNFLSQPISAHTYFLCTFFFQTQLSSRHTILHMHIFSACTYSQRAPILHMHVFSKHAYSMHALILHAPFLSAHLLSANTYSAYTPIFHAPIICANLFFTHLFSAGKYPCAHLFSTYTYFQHTNA